RYAPEPFCLKKLESLPIFSSIWSNRMNAGPPIPPLRRCSVPHRHRIGVNHREFLQVGYSGLLGIGLSSLLTQRAPGAEARTPKSVIIVYLTGAPSHLD